MTTDSPRGAFGPDALLAHREWIERVARALVLGTADADDVAQQVWADVLARPPAAEPTHLRAWLRSVLRFKALDAGRAARTRARHEESAARGERDDEDPAGIVARAELLQRVGQTVLSLEEPYRTTVLLRWFEDLPPRDIAERQGVPVETVRTRLKRALQHLRGRLDDAHGGDRRAWAVAFLPLVRPVSPTAAPAAATAGASASTAAGVLLMGLKTKIAAAVVAAALLSAGAWQFLRPETSDAEPRLASGVVGGDERPTTASSTGRPGRAAGPADGASDATPNGTSIEESLSDARRPARWLLRGRLENFEPDDAARAAVSVYAFRGDERTLPAARRVEEARGRFEVDVTEEMTAARRPRTFAVVVDHPRYLQAQADVAVPPAPEAADADADGTATSAAIDCTVPMTRAVLLSVRVLDEAGRPVPDAQVGAFPFVDGQPSESTDDERRCDAAGTAQLRTRPGVARLVAAARPGFAPSLVILRGTESSATVVMDAGVAIEGRVTREGLALAGAQVRAIVESYGERTLRFAGEEFVWEKGRLLPAPSGAVTDAEGRYRIEGLRPSRYRVQVETAGPGVRCLGFSRPVDAPATDVDFDVSTGTVLVEVRSGGKPVPEVRLFGLAEAGTDIVESDAEGRAEVHVAPGLAFQIQAERDGYRVMFVRFTAPAAGAREVVTVDLEPLPPRGRLIVRVEDGEGRPIDCSSLALFRGEDSALSPTRFTLVTDCVGGRIEVADAEPGDYRLVVRPGRSFHADFTWDGDEGTWLDVVTEVKVPASGEKEVVATSRRGGRMRIAARDPKGHLVAATCEIRGPAGEIREPLLAARHGTRGAYSACVGLLDNDDVSELAEALPPGRYLVRVHDDESSDERTVEAVVEAGKTCLVEVKLDGAGRAGPPPRWETAPATPR